MAKKMKFTTTIDVETKQSLDKMSESLGKPINQILDFIVESYYRKSWPRKLKNYQVERKRELERILQLRTESL